MQQRLADRKKNFRELAISDSLFKEVRRNEEQASGASK
jgi:hypothetical protein